MKFLFILLALLSLYPASTLRADNKIDRKSLVNRHNIITTQVDSASPAQVGNGEFAFGVDVTGLQTFIPFNTMSHWSWHSFPLPKGMRPDDYKGRPIESFGRVAEGYALMNSENKKQDLLSKWRVSNPHRFNLGRIGMNLLLENGNRATAKDIADIEQETDLWTGIITSRFTLEGIPVEVRTACHPELDKIAVEIKSDLIKEKRLSVFFHFPYYKDSYMLEYVGDYTQPEKHRTSIKKRSGNSVTLSRKMDAVEYSVLIDWRSDASFDGKKEKSPHYFELSAEQGSTMAFNCLFTQDENRNSDEDVFNASRNGWKDFWNSGAAVDLSESKDPRWKELERRIVLSQYLMKVNEAGSLPPQESGLVNNGWFGRFHFEMIWWHGVHYALWNRWDLFDNYLKIYRDYLPTSRIRADKQGYKGARWPKCTGNVDREWPCIIHATLIWQQPHPIYFAELDYRQHPTQATLEKWKDVVFATADFMASLPHYDAEKDRYVLGPPLYIVSENVRPGVAFNPAFELGYWKFGLRVAREWRKRLSLPANPEWDDVYAKLSDLPVKDGVYTTYEGIPEMWTKYIYEHPGLIGTLGMLPGDGVDKEIFSRTLQKVSEKWRFNRIWGWDFPMLAMAAARDGKPDKAIDFLLHGSPNFQFDVHGLATGGPFPYFPSNGALLTAVAMMAEGWDGSEGEFPGFPKDGSWKVKAEGLVKMP